MILVFGTVCLDRVRRVAALPPAGGYVEVESEMVLLGGEAANTANALQRWGDEAVLAGNPLGNSVESAELKGLLSAAGLESIEILDPVREVKEVLTPVCDIYVTPDGERTMFGRGFSALEAFASSKRVPWATGDWFTAEPNMEHLSREAAREAHRRGMRLYLMDFVRDDDPIFPGSYWQSSTDWAGFRNDAFKNVRWVEQWVEKRGCFSILSDGRNGFVAGSPDFPARAFPPFPAPLILDTTGAGDVFRAGMLHGLSRGWSIGDCLRFASAAGCLSCVTVGATVSVPSDEEIKSHIAEHPEVAKLYD